MKNFARSPRSIRGPAAAVAFMSDSFVAVPSLPSHVVHWFPTPTVSGFLPAQCCFHDDFCDYLFSWNYPPSCCRGALQICVNGNYWNDVGSSNGKS